MRCRAVVDLEALTANYRYLCQLTGETAEVLCVVKADAYGHGAVAVARALAAAGARHFGVATLAEAAEIRDAGVAATMVVLGGLDAGEEREAALLGVEPLIGSVDQLRRWDEAAAERGRSLDCHLLLNTGMNRLGIDLDPSSPASCQALTEALADCPRAMPAGIATHYASAERFDSDQTDWQESLFQRQQRVLREAGLRPRYVHAANSASLLHRRAGTPDGAPGHTMVRPGLALYGYVKEAVGLSQPLEHPLRRALEWRAGLRSIRDVPAGSALGYGATYVASRPMRIGVLSVGYADGLDWRLSNRGAVSVRGARCDIVGEISMDLAIVDLGPAAGAAVGDEAILLGESPYDAQGMAKLADGSPYQTLCGISKRVPRQYIGAA